jgi:fructose transport system permease protein
MSEATTIRTLDHVSSSETTIEKIRGSLHSHAIAGPSIVLGLLIVLFSIVGTNFLAANNVSLVIQQVMVVGTLAIGQTLIILTAGVDLSVGFVALLSSIVMAKMSADAGLPGVVCILIGLAVGMACGLANGLLVAKVKLPPFIVTLGTLQIFSSLTYWYSKSATITANEMSSVLLWTGNTFSIGGTNFTYGSVLMLLLFAIMIFVLRSTAWGRHLYATGDDPESARLSGIRTDRVLISAYVVAGLIYAIGAWVIIGRVGSASPNSAQDANLDTISAVVIGGTSLFGGRGRLAGTLVGALIVGVLRNGLGLAGVEVVWQGAAIGLLIIAAVAIDRWIRGDAK